MNKTPDPPRTYEEFSTIFPELIQAWEIMSLAGQNGPLDPKTVRLIKLAVAVGAMRRGAVRANARKALAIGITKEELRQIITLASGTLGMPSTVAVYSWIRDAEQLFPEHE